MQEDITNGSYSETSSDDMQKDMFWKAALLTIVILIIGIAIGIWIDSGRSEEIKSTLTENEILLNDVRLQSLYYEGLLKESPELCSIAFNANLDYNYRIYQEGLKLERYEQHNKFSSSLMLERRRYTLQQMQFWLNANKIKELCNFNYTTLLHLYLYDTGNNSDVEMPQKLQSAVLLDLKERCGTRLMLSPMAIDMNLTAVNMVVEAYNISKTPAMIINSNVVLQGFSNLTKLEEYIKC